MKRLLTLFAATVLMATSCRDDGVTVEKLRGVYDRGDTLILNKHLFIRDKMMGDYVMNTRDGGDKILRTKAYDRRAKDRKPLGFDFSHDGRRILPDTIGHRTAEILRYEGLLP